MWKIYTTLNSDLKRYDPYKKIIAGRICFLEEEAVIVVGFGMLYLRTLLKKCSMKIYVGFINFSDDF